MDTISNLQLHNSWRIQADPIVISMEFVESSSHKMIWIWIISQSHLKVSRRMPNKFKCQAERAYIVKVNSIVLLIMAVITILRKHQTFVMACYRHIESGRNQVEMKPISITDLPTPIRTWNSSTKFSFWTQTLYRKIKENTIPDILT